MAENKDEMGKTASQRKTILFIVIGFAILTGLLILLLNGNSSEDVSKPDQEISDPQNITEEPEIISGNDIQQDSPSDTDDADNDSDPTSSPTSNLDKRLPENWHRLSDQEKTAVNPHRCFEGSTIRSDNGRCVVKGTQINYVLLANDNPQAYLPGLLGRDTFYYYVGVPDNMSEDDMDKLFEFFKSSQPYSAGSTIIERNKYLGVPADVWLDEFQIFYYSDIRFGDDFLKGVGIDGSARRAYLLAPRHTFKAPVFDDHGYGNDGAVHVYEVGRNGLLSSGCEFAVDLVLFYRPKSVSQIYIDDIDTENIDVVSYYGPSSPTADDFKSVMVDDQGGLESKFRQEIFNSFQQTIQVSFKKDKLYDILLRFYRYDDDKGNDLSLYGADDTFIPDIHVIECS